MSTTPQHAITATEHSRADTTWHGAAAMSVMLLGMIDTMIPGAGFLPRIVWVAVYLAAALAVAAAGRLTAQSAHTSAHRALCLVLMAVLTLTMAAPMRTTSSPSMPRMPGMSSPELLPVAMVGAFVFVAWSAHDGIRTHRLARAEALCAAASIALMAVCAIT